MQSEKKYHFFLTEQFIAVIDKAIQNLSFREAAPVVKELSAQFCASQNPCESCSFYKDKICASPDASQVGILSAMSLPVLAKKNGFCAIKEENERNN